MGEIRGYTLSSKERMPVPFSHNMWLVRNQNQSYLHWDSGLSAFGFPILGGVVIRSPPLPPRFNSPDLRRRFRGGRREAGPRIRTIA